MHSLTQLLLDRHDLSMRDALARLALMHCTINQPGFVLALTGHYRKAFEQLRAEPFSTANRYAIVQRLYLLAMYAEQLEPANSGYLVRAEAELKYAIGEIESRYGWEWVSFADLRYEMDLYAELEQAAKNQYRPPRAVFPAVSQ